MEEKNENVVEETTQAQEEQKKENFKNVAKKFEKELQKNEGNLLAATQEILKLSLLFPDMDFINLAVDSGTRTSGFWFCSDKIRYPCNPFFKGFYT